MASKRLNLSNDDFALPFAGEWGERFPPILSPALLAELLGLSIKTIYLWLQEGRFDGAYRKRGKRCLIWRDRALDRIFNSGDWKCRVRTTTE